MTSLPDALARQIQSAGEAFITALLAVAAATALCLASIAVLFALADGVKAFREHLRTVATPHIGSMDVVGPWCGRG